MGKYTLLYNIDRIEYMGDDEVEIGKVVDSETREDIFYIYYNKNLYVDEGYHICVDVYEDENREYVVAKVDDLHRGCLMEEPEIFLCLMLHEYGHYINGDLMATGVTNQMIQEERLKCIMEGRVMEIEKNADKFAIMHVGKHTFMRSMNYMIRKRRERGDRDMQFAIREFELRKIAAREFWQEMNI